MKIDQFVPLILETKADANINIQEDIDCPENKTIAKLIEETNDEQTIPTSG